jgi:serine/threonine-protein kinase
MILCAFYFSFNMIMKAVIHVNGEVTVPDIVGKDIYEGLEELSKGGFALKKRSEEFNPKIPTGTVLRQHPDSGAIVRKGRIIKVDLSKGGEVVFVPDIAGQDLSSAVAILQKYSLVLGEVDKIYSVNIDKDIVIEQSVSPKSKVEKFSAVNVVVSQGLPPDGTIYMPNFVNKNIDEAQNWVVENGINALVHEVKTQGVEKGIIVKQDPAPDTDITKYKKVEIFVSADDGKI